MKQFYDARRATPDEIALVHDTMEFVVTLGDTIVCHLPLLGVASTMASILNQEYTQWEKQAATGESPYTVKDNHEQSELRFDVVCGTRRVLKAFYTRTQAQQIADTLNKEITGVIKSLEEKALENIKLNARIAELEAVLRESAKILSVSIDRVNIHDAIEDAREVIANALKAGGNE